MIRPRVVGVAYAILVVVTSACTAAIDGTKWDFPLYLSTKTPYTPQQSYVDYEKPPPTCKLEYFEGLFRHGSRYDTKLDSAKTAQKVLVAAKKNNGLTQKGAQALEWVELFIEEAKDNLGLLSQRGAQEVYGIGRRLARRHRDSFLDLFRQHKRKLGVDHTWKHRTRQSKEAFLQGFKETFSDEHIDWHKIIDDFGGTNCSSSSLPREYDKLRFFDTCQRYLDHTAENTWEKPLKSFKNLIDDYADSESSTVHHFLAEIFDDQNFLKAWVSGIQDTKLPSVYKFLDAMLGVCGIEDYKKYMKMGPFRGVNYVPACLLMSDAFSRADSALASRVTVDTDGFFVHGDPTNDVYGGFLHFAHAETTEPLLSLLLDSSTQDKSNITEAYQQCLDSFIQFNHSNDAQEQQNVSCERDYELSTRAPMAANIQFEFYQCDSDTLVSVLLNEKQLHLPACNYEVFCNWPQFKHYYAQLYKEYGISNCSPSDWKSYCKKRICGEDNHIEPANVKLLDDDA